MNEQTKGVCVGACGILLRTRNTQILRKMILLYVKIQTLQQWRTWLQLINLTQSTGNLWELSTETEY